MAIIKSDSFGKKAIVMETEEEARVNTKRCRSCKYYREERICMNSNKDNYPYIIYDWVDCKEFMGKEG